MDRMRCIDVDETPFELHDVTIRRDRCFTDDFDIVDFLGRYESLCVYMCVRE